jgi:hypothetical protein
MRSPFCSLFRGWRAALLLAAGVCLSPQRAAAECGDYVHILNAPAASTQHATPGTPETPAPAAPPCQGPNCSGAPVRHAPPPGPVTPAGPQAKEVVQSLDPVAATDGPRSTFDRGFTSARPVHRPSSVFHPPRLG